VRPGERWTIRVTAFAAVLSAAATLAGAIITKDDSPVDCVSRDVRVVELVQQFPDAVVLLEWRGDDDLDEECGPAAEIARFVRETREQERREQLRKRRQARRR
jgi:hypothetical protein